MTQRIFIIVSLLLIVFHFNTSFAEDDLTLDDSFASDTATTSPAPADSAVPNPLDDSLNAPAAPVPESASAIPAETDELTLDSEIKDASTPPATDSTPSTDINSLDSIVDGQTPAPSNEDEFATALGSQNVDQSENVNLASPIEIRQREGALYGFSAGLIMSSGSFLENYDKVILSGNEPLYTEKVDKQTNAIQNFGIILRYAETPYYRIGTDINISYLKSQNHNSITVNSVDILGEITTLKGEVNLSYAIEMGVLPIYFLAGIGFERVTGNSIEKIINSSGYGGQAGGGFVINSTINLEAMYSYYVHRISNAIVEAYANGVPKVTIDTEKGRVISQGLLVRGTFSFNF